jgi:hypothetical protein
LVSVNPAAMKKLIALIFVVILIPAYAYSQIGAKTQQNKIHGVWQTNSNGQQMTLILNADGRGEFDGSEITFTTLGNKLSISADGATTNYTYVLQGNSLTVSGGDIEGKVVFTRGGATTEPTASAPSPTQTTASANSIVGIWSGNNETVEFTKAGQCVYQGQVFPYQTANGTVTLQTSQGNVNMPYSANGNQLSLTINGQTFYYAKNGATPIPGSTQPAQSTTGGGKTIAQELVGKWCYVNVNSYNSGASSSEQCITLKADGTYEYYSESSRSVNTGTYSGGTNSQNSDTGTWSYDGSRIHYSSSVGKGSGSYLLEKRNHPKNNDPMIVLDGQTYVTQYQKAPWR